jgi:group II intron reverse transcriptase/maturase
MTPGATPETLDEISLEKLTQLSNQLKAGKFRFNPRRRVFIPKPGTKHKRPLLIRSPMDKVVQKALQLVLEAVYEPSFLEFSHGFRPQKGTHTALKAVSKDFKRVTWVIEADITKCFDRFNHQVLLNTLKERIDCHKTLALVKSSLEAGYVDLSNFVKKADLGTPQGSVLSPLLCNVYLHKLDQFVLELMTQRHKGVRRKGNPEFVRLYGRMER